MRVVAQPQRVRGLVARTFGELGTDVRSLSDLDETILLDDGTYAARSYRFQGLMAIWLVPAGILQFYDDAGNMVRTLNLFDESEPKNVAA